MKKKLSIKTIIIVLLLGLTACLGAGNVTNSRVRADSYNYEPYYGKTIKSVEYWDPQDSGDILEFTFTDGSTLKIWAYKYKMEIQL